MTALIICIVVALVVLLALSVWLHVRGFRLAMTQQATIRSQANRIRELNREKRQQVRSHGLPPWARKTPELPAPEGADGPSIDDVVVRARLRCAAGWQRPINGQAYGQSTIVDAVADTLGHDPVLREWPEDEDVEVLGVRSGRNWSRPDPADHVTTARVTAGGWHGVWASVKGWVTEVWCWPGTQPSYGGGS